MLTVYFDLAHNIPAFDIVSPIMAGEAERLRRGDEGLAIEIVPGAHEGFRAGKLWPCSTAERRAMLHNVVLPICALLPSCRRVTVHDARPAEPVSDSIGFDKFMGFANFVTAYAAGVRPLRQRATCYGLWARGGFRDPIVTLTLREAEHWPARNSNLEEWRGAARMLALMGYRVIVVRDTLRADELLDGVETCPRAAREIATRAALYRDAACNLFVDNGPAWLAFALDAPAIIFRPTCEDAGRMASIEGRRAIGIFPGEQLVGAPAHQRLAWQGDTADNLVAAAVEILEGR